MGIFRDAYLKASSEEKLRKKEEKMFDKLNKVGWFENKTNEDKYWKLENKRLDYVNAIGSKSADKLPKREHGWYISKDD